MEKDGEGAFSQSFRPIIYLFLGNSHNTAYNYRCTMLTKSLFVPSTILCTVTYTIIFRSNQTHRPKLKSEHWIQDRIVVIEYYVTLLVFSLSVFFIYFLISHFLLSEFIKKN